MHVSWRAFACVCARASCVCECVRARVVCVCVCAGNFQRMLYDATKIAKKKHCLISLEICSSINLVCYQKLKMLSVDFQSNISTVTSDTRCPPRAATIRHPFCLRRSVVFVFAV